MAPAISIIVPAYNEAARLSESLKTIFNYLRGGGADAEVIVVDDGSADETTAVAERGLAAAGDVPARLIRNHPNRGKGHAVRTGLLAARAPIALFTDADLSTPISEVPKLVAPIEQGVCDLTFGSRALDRSLIGVHQPWRREQGGRAFNLVVRLATRLPFWDTQCGFKAFRMDACRPVIEGATIDRFGFDVELLYVAHLAGLRLREIPVRWDHSEGSKVSMFRDSLRMFGEVQRIRRQARAGRYQQIFGDVEHRAAGGGASHAELNSLPL
ncbi:MAG TPA: dolichyl-phosphate beta-glucosyltransferase [Pyrinomonadaceae bacterium]|jgi:glycosyltransferase involved in cell wall biosynthesis